MNIESYKKCSSAISLQGREKSVRKSSIRAKYEVELISNNQYLTVLKNELANSFNVDLLNLGNAMITISKENGVSVVQGVSQIVSEQGLTKLNSMANSTEIVNKQGVQLFVLFDKNGQQLSSAKGLTQVKDEKSMFRGIFRKKGKISGHVKLKPVDARDAAQQVNTAKSALTSKLATSMQLASVVVGQYYMSEVSEKLSQINDELHALRRYHQTEILAKLGTMRESLDVLANNQTELLADEQIRNNYLLKIDGIKTELATINNQSLLQINGVVDRAPKNEQQFIKDVNELDYWKQISVITTNILIFASELEYIYGVGALSRKTVTELVSSAKDKNEEADSNIAEYLHMSALKFELTSKSASGRLQRQNDKFSKLPAPAAVKKVATNLAVFISERADYGLNFSMSDEKLEAIVPALERITESETIDLKVDRIANEMNEDVNLLVTDGMMNYVTSK
ncbi:hypothetical protein [Weissella cibaria]|uniref:Uncharacterized protein n=2 Tax=Weissella cibaria TaxID=137591 RepID=A0A9Q8JIT7_9LACO|nr:hypothetical protein [Weissella cibaria]TVV27652.1 hypothetical protein FO435_07050 [Weissella cibaria]TVV40844.1 hypothetical protein FO438_06880 [Weissella cibaria]